MTKTSESEYSPLVTPDRRSFSTVRVEADGTQRLWRFDLDGANPRLVLEGVKGVGYHVWIDATHLGLFVLGAQQGDPSTLQLVDTVSGSVQVVATAIARSLLVRPGTATISFIATPRGEPRLVKTIHPQTRAIETVGPALDGSQDAVWWPDGRVVMARGRVLYALTPGTTAWTELATLVPSTSANFDQITRLALSPDGRWIAFAAEPR